MLLTKQQWLGAALLALMIAAVEVFVHLVPQRPLPPAQQDSALLSVADTLSRTSKHYRYRRDTVTLCLRSFDPNTADSLTLLRLGLQPWQVRNMLKYRAKGGSYRRPEDMRRLYGMTDSLYALLRPYIAIDSSRFLLPADTVQHAASQPLAHPKKDTLIELNAADTAALQYIRGIGPATACAIIRYREALGGYARTEQLREIPRRLTYVTWDIPWDSILPHLTACPDSVRQIPVNCVSVSRLAQHPYLRFEQAKALYEHRRNRFELHSIDDLRALPCFSDSLLTSLAPYLSFEPCHWK